MRHILAAVPLILAAIPSYSASGPFFSLGNTNFVVLISFILFIGAIIYFKAPKFVVKLIDGQIDKIRKQLDEAAALRESAIEHLNRAEREKEEARERAERILENAKADAETMVAQAAETIDLAVRRRLEATQEQLAMAEAAAVAEIKNKAIDVAVQSAAMVIADQLTPVDRRKLFDRAMRDVEDNLD